MLAGGPIQIANQGARIIASVAIGDADGDGKPEIAGGTSETFGAAGNANETRAYLIEAETREITVTNRGAAALDLAGVQLPAGLTALVDAVSIAPGEAATLAAASSVGPPSKPLSVRQRRRSRAPVSGGSPSSSNLASPHVRFVASIEVSALPSSPPPLPLGLPRPLPFVFSSSAAFAASAFFCSPQPISPTRSLFRILKSQMSSSRNLTAIGQSGSC